MRPPPTNTASARLRIRPPGSSRGPGSLCLALGLYRVHGDTVPTKCRSEAHTVHRPLMHPSTTSPIFPRHPFTQASTSSARKVCVVRVRVRVRLRYTHQTRQTQTHTHARTPTRTYSVHGIRLRGRQAGQCLWFRARQHQTSTSTSTGRPRCSLAYCIVLGSTLL